MGSKSFNATSIINSDMVPKKVSMQKVTDNVIIVDNTVYQCIPLSKISEILIHGADDPVVEPDIPSESVDEPAIVNPLYAMQKAKKTERYFLYTDSEASLNTFVLKYTNTDNGSAEYYTTSTYILFDTMIRKFCTYIDNIPKEYSLGRAIGGIKMDINTQNEFIMKLRRYVRNNDDYNEEKFILSALNAIRVVHE